MTQTKTLLFDFAFLSTMAKKKNHTPSFLNSAQKYYTEQFTTVNDDHSYEQNHQTEEKSTLLSS